jgi:hypothetical protein
MNKNLYIYKKPCPFCGGRAETIARWMGETAPEVYTIGCETTGCFLEHGSDVSYDRAVDAWDAWNKRAKEDA